MIGAVADGDQTGLHHELTNYVRDRVTAAIAAGIQPASAQAGSVVDDLVAHYAETFGATDSGEYRAKLLTRLAIANVARSDLHLVHRGAATPSRARTDYVGASARSADRPIRVVMPSIRRSRPKTYSCSRLYAA
jgi:hypothetical protein